MSENTVNPTNLVVIRQTSADTTTSSGEEKRTADKAPVFNQLAQARQDVAGGKIADTASVNEIKTENPLLKLKPQLLWKHFNEITKLYRPSQKEAKMGDYIIKIAKENGLEFKKDEVGNIFVSIPASAGMENAPRTIIQGHQDMACVDEKGEHDFEKEPMKVKVEGGKVTAEGTTLGADNGIGISAMLAIMEDKTLKHGPLGLLFTVDEEADWTGVGNLPKSLLIPSDSKHLINVDADTVQVAYIGSAGAQETNATMKLNFAQTNIENPVQIQLDINGLTGGHSGVDIGKGRANAIKLISRVLFKLNNAMPMDLVSIDGGPSKYAITRKSSAVIVISQKNVPIFEKILKEEEKEFLLEYKKTDPDFKVTAKKLEEKPSKVIVKEQKDKIINMLNVFPHGALSMSKDIKDLVETSTNFAVVKTNGDTLEVSTTQRSSIEAAQGAASDSVKSALVLAGFKINDITTNVVCPSCAPNINSELVKIYKKVSDKVLDNPAEIRAVHAGDEFSAIIKVWPQLNVIAIGPSYHQEHNPGENVEIKSVEQFYNILNGMLEEIGKQKK